MNTKSLIVLIFLSCFASLAKAQFLNIGGITIQATAKLYVDGDEAKSEPADQLYNISFKDLILAHNIYYDGVLDVSQIYQLSNINRYMDGSTTMVKFSALSGRSGMTYKYVLKIGSDGKLISLVCTEENGNKTTYKGGISELKTFKQ